MLDSCFHAAHATCITKGSRKCVLCSKPYEILIPVSNSNIDEGMKAYVLMSWWEQDFKPDVTRVSGKKTDN